MAIRQLTDDERLIYGAAVTEAVLWVGPFRDAVVLLRPYFDTTASTAYTDRYARVGLSKWFFEECDPAERASVILHETMHVLNGHFARAESIGVTLANSEVFNLGGDMEINSTLSTVSRVNLSKGIMPDQEPFKFKKFLSMEQYISLLNERIESKCTCGKNKQDDSADNPQGGQDGSDSGGNSGNSGDDDSKSEGGSGSGGNGGNGQDGESGSDSGNGESDSSSDTDNSNSSNSSSGSDSSGQQGSSSGQGSGKSPCPVHDHTHGDSGPPCGCPGESGKACDNPSEERSSEADAAGVERASEIEQSIAKNNTKARIQESLKGERSAGTGSLNELLEVTLKRMEPPKVPWQTILRRLISQTNENICAGRSDHSYRRPNRRGHDSPFLLPGMIAYKPKGMMGIDTSGSMGQDDFLALLSEAEHLLKAVSKGRDFRVFSVDTKVGKMSRVRKVADIKLTGGGGTDQAVAIEYVRALPKREKPDIFVLATDGFTPWDTFEAQLDQVKNEFVVIVLITTLEGFAGVPPHLKKKAKFIDISRKENQYKS